VEGTRKLPPDLQIGLYRITQEALNNIVKHAKATQATVTLHLNDAVRLSICDNGSGFDLTSVTPDHLGLRIMCERAEAIGGKFSISSQPGVGTQIFVSWTPSSDPCRTEYESRAVEE
jgi:signal transduction histidine kinase